MAPTLINPSDTSGAIVLSPDQEEALSRLLVWFRTNRVGALVGPAGTGKTTVIQALVRRARAMSTPMFSGFVYLAPTGRAAVRMQEQGAPSASTIHSGLFSSVEEMVDLSGKTTKKRLTFKDPRPPCHSGELVLVDEASMIPPRLAETLEAQVIKGGGYLLYLGDTAQLPPVERRGQGIWAPAMERPTASLTQIHRQAADNPIISVATAVRKRQPPDWPQDDARCAIWDLSAQGESQRIQLAAQWLVNYRNAGVDATLITWENAVRRSLNEAVRQHLGETEPVYPGARLVCRKNDKRLGIMNGETLDVLDCYHVGDLPSSKIRDQEAYIDRVCAKRKIPKPPVLDDHRVFRIKLGPHADNWVDVAPGLMERLQGDFWEFSRFWRTWIKWPRLLHVWPGDCLTAHLAQGSQFHSVGVYVNGKMANYVGRSPFGSNLFYTAITRASDELRIFWGAS